MEPNAGGGAAADDDDDDEAENAKPLVVFVGAVVG